MRHPLAHLPALLILLVHAVLGTVSPAAVICVSHARTGGPPGGGMPAGGCGQHACCTADASTGEAPQSIALSVPCDAGCPGCVDIRLPDLDMLGASRAAPDTPVPDPCSRALPQLDAPGLPPGPSAWPPATGPPRRAGCPHRAVLRSTRLLL
ncbi:MAG: hypothetical protein KF817_00115 [Phycisphaeraceae bacterium]|nr:hypothetical protein [Phycisphaeraceae bacterium]